MKAEKRERGKGEGKAKSAARSTTTIADESSRRHSGRVQYGGKQSKYLLSEFKVFELDVVEERVEVILIDLVFAALRDELGQVAFRAL